jgi:hypothetical protein
MPKHTLSYVAKLYDTEGDFLGEFSKPPVLTSVYPEFILTNKDITKMRGVGPGKEPDTTTEFPRIFKAKGWVAPLTLRFVEKHSQNEEAEPEEVSEVIEVKPDPFTPPQAESAVIPAAVKKAPQLDDLAG